MSALVMTDNADGTGATATITGSAGGANVVYVGKATGATGTIAFSAAANRVGDGTVLVPVTSLGLWWAYLTTDGVWNGLVYFSATNGVDAVASRCRRAVVDTIKLLTIPPAANVYEQAYPDESNVRFPCTLVTVEGVSETDERGLSTRDDVGRPVKVMIADRASRHDFTKLPAWELWRQRMERCFKNQQLAGVPESKICRIEDFNIIDPNLPAFEYMVSAFVVRCVTREPRGVGA